MVSSSSLPVRARIGRLDERCAGAAGHLRAPRRARARSRLRVASAHVRDRALAHVRRCSLARLAPCSPLAFSLARSRAAPSRLSRSRSSRARARPWPRAASACDRSSRARAPNTARCSRLMSCRHAMPLAASAARGASNGLRRAARTASPFIASTCSTNTGVAGTSSPRGRTNSRTKAGSPSTVSPAPGRAAPGARRSSSRSSAVRRRPRTGT